MAAVYTVAKSDYFLFAGLPRTWAMYALGVIPVFFLNSWEKYWGVVSKSHLLGHVLYLIQTLWGQQLLGGFNPCPPGGWRIWCLFPSGIFLLT